MTWWFPNFRKLSKTIFFFDNFEMSASQLHYILFWSNYIHKFLSDLEFSKFLEFRFMHFCFEFLFFHAYRRQSQSMFNFGLFFYLFYFISAICSFRGDKKGDVNNNPLLAHDFTFTLYLISSFLSYRIPEQVMCS